MKKKTGFVSIIGRPSSGKSTLVNTICGYKISIVSKHPQTTRFLVKGIYNDDESQIVFLDTPGYHNFNSQLNKTLSTLAVKSANEGDLIMYVVDMTREFGEEENAILDKIKYFGIKIVVVFNKSDDQQHIVPGIKEEILKRIKPAGHIEVSALKNDNINTLIDQLKNNLEYGDIYFPEEYVTDQDMNFRISETVREKVFNNTSEEIPHSTYVEIETLKVKDDRIIANAVIFVEKDSQKGIIIGKGGAMIKKIGLQARKDLSEIFECEVDLFLHVKVNLNWRKKDDFIKKIYGNDYF